MSKGKRVRDEVPEKILKRHNEIRRRYEEMLDRVKSELCPAYHQRAHLMSGQYWLRMKFG